MGLGLLRLTFLSVMVNGTWEAQWRNGQCSGLQIERSGFEPWLEHCVVFLGKTLYSHGAFLQLRCINGYRPIHFWSNPEKD